MELILYDHDKINSFRTKLRVSHRQYKLNDIEFETNDSNLFINKIQGLFKAFSLNSYNKESKIK